MFKADSKRLLLIQPQQTRRDEKEEWLQKAPAMLNATKSGLTFQCRLNQSKVSLLSPKPDRKPDPVSDQHLLDPTHDSSQPDLLCSTDPIQKGDRFKGLGIKPSSWTLKPSIPKSLSDPWFNSSVSGATHFSWKASQGPV